MLSASDRPAERMISRRPDFNLCEMKNDCSFPASVYHRKSGFNVFQTVSAASAVLADGRAPAASRPDSRNPGITPPLPLPWSYLLRHVPFVFIIFLGYHFFVIIFSRSSFRFREMAAKRRIPYIFRYTVLHALKRSQSS